MKKKKYNTGGDISSILGAASPLLSLIPGAQALSGPLSAFSALTSALSPMFESSGDKRVGHSPGAYATGGDISLSKQSFQVKGNPNVYDSEEFTTPNGPIKLDHNEVIKGSFAFSNRLRNPATGNTFAEDVAPIEKSTAKASKRAILANDPISRNTITANEKRTESIANIQEALATLMGKRSQGKDPKNAAALGYQSGGTIFPGSTLQQNKFIPDTAQLLQQPATAFEPSDDLNADIRDSLLKLDPNVYSLSSEQFASKLRSQDPEAYKMMQRAKYGANTIDDNLGRDSYMRHVRQRELANRPRYRADGGSFQSGGSIQSNDDLRLYRQQLLPSTDPLSLLAAPPGYTKASPTDWEYLRFGQEGFTPGRTLPEVTISTSRLNRPKTSYSMKSANKPLTRAEEVTANMEIQRSRMNMGTAPDLTFDPLGLGLTPTAPLTASQRAAQLPTPTGVQVLQSQPTVPINTVIPNSIRVPPTVGDNTNMRTTIGDVFQGVEVGSKFLQLLGGPEVEKPYLDRTPVTKQAYDPRQAMYQNQANFQAQSNNLQTSSAPLRRALQNSLYAKKLDSDSQILSKYQEMNNQATTQYQDRLSNRQRYNNQQMNYTDDINARNRGQHMNATQNAFTSLGNFGEALNTKRQNYDALNILRVIYPDIYGRISNAIK